MNIVVLSGGTAANSILPALDSLSKDLSFILPISDNGGSTSEILRVVGGPAIGDIRSRIVSMIKDPLLAELFGYRLSDDVLTAKQEWNSIVDGTHDVWKDIPSQVKEICRSFMVHIQAELLKKHKNSAPFQFEKASVGNLFLTGIRLFLGSLDASIELMLRLCRCEERISVIPCINTNHTHHISALLANGEVITGQSQISHPSKQMVSNSRLRSAVLEQNNSSSSLVGPDTLVHLNEDDVDEEDDEEYAYPGYIHPQLKLSQLHFDKLDINEDHLLPAPIKRIFYINPYGEEVLPQGNSRAISKLKQCDLVLYSIGSLMTSLLPITILGNIAESIVDNSKARKVLLINNKYDRETFGLDGFHFVQMIIESMDRAVHSNIRKRRTSRVSRHEEPIPWQKFITDVVYLEKGEILVDTLALNSNGIRTHAIGSDTFDNEVLLQTLQSLQN
ncbi:LAFE_0F09560g1_1 [Lachancea fermentati]|uniref:LAFE_0F09560g1_1 n=1 Tax=Lachancea fermentati TaxID=4955 RepID=A0A1G4MFP3_LACFM|nr:LAFE_0F09560g1_1 [Lachancea fermentati]